MAQVASLGFVPLLGGSTLRGRRVARVVFCSWCSRPQLFVAPVRVSRASAQTGPAPRDRTTPCALVHSTSVSQDLALSSGICVLSSAWLLALQMATSAGLLPRQVNRKIVHITCAPFLMLFWPLYSDAVTSRFAAALVPLAFTARLLVSTFRNRRVIQTAAQDTAEVRNIDTLAASITRAAGDSISEALRGPLAYLVVLSAMTLVCWRNSAVSAVVVGQLCFGDGFADIVGRTFGKGSEWNCKLARGKTIVGSAAFSVAGFIGSYGLIFFLQHVGCIPNSLSNSWTFPCLAVISVFCGAVEVLFPDLDDNYSVSFAAAALAVLFRL